MAGRCYYGGKSSGYKCTDECPFFNPSLTNKCNIYPLNQTRIIGLLLDLMREVKILKEKASTCKCNQKPRPTQEAE